MRVAYIAPYQGPGVLRSRPVPPNVGLAANLKIELIAKLLRANGHQVEVISQGEIAARRARFYPAFAEPDLFDREIPVHYASALPLKFVNGYWSSRMTLALFKRRHRAAPFDVAIIYNLNLPQMMCARYLAKHMHLPVILQYEDDAMVNVSGKSEAGLKARVHLRMAKATLDSATAGIGVSPHLLSQLPPSVPKLLLRGAVGEDIVQFASKAPSRKNWVIYSGTHARSKGLEQLIEAWRTIDLPDWELHVTGRGEITEKLEQMSKGLRTIVFHGLLSRGDLVDVLAQAKIGINPHNVSTTPGNVFAFKIVEYLAAGLHVVSTPMGEVEPELEAGMTLMTDNTPGTIRATLERVIREDRHLHTAPAAALGTYGPAAVAKALENLLKQAFGSPTGQS